MTGIDIGATQVPNPFSESETHGSVFVCDLRDEKDSDRWLWAARRFWQSDEHEILVTSCEQDELNQRKLSDRPAVVLWIAAEDQISEMVERLSGLSQVRDSWFHIVGCRHLPISERLILREIGASIIVRSTEQLSVLTGALQRFLARPVAD